MKVDVELPRSADAEDLAQSLSAQGIEANLLEQPGHVLVAADDLAAVGHALDGWTAERGLPFVPQHMDDGHFVLSPPGS